MANATEVDVLNASAASSSSSSSTTTTTTTTTTPLQDVDFLLLELKLVLSALGIIYLGSHAALRRPPSAAPRRGSGTDAAQKQRDRDRDRDRSSLQGLEPSDAIVFPLMAAVVLVALYYLILWLKDPAVLNKILRYYMSTVSVASVLTLYAHAIDLAASLAFPTYWRGGDGLLRRADQTTRTVAVCDDVGNAAPAAGPPPPRSSPVPGPLGGLLAGSERATGVAWELRGLLTRHWRLRLFVHGVGEETAKVRFSHMTALLLSVATALVYFSTTSPLLSNVLGIGMCYSSFLILSPTDLLTGSLVLWGLFFYDILMVFYTPYMITVATTLDVPIKLAFEAGSRKSILGLGDIVIPGMLIAWALRLDLWLHYVGKLKYEPASLRIVERDPSTGLVAQRSDTKHRQVKARYVEVKNRWGDGLWTRGGRLFLRRPRQLPADLAAARFPKVYFRASMAGYALGMAATLAMLLVFERGQPALLYLVPGVLGSLVATALARGQLGDVCRYTEDGSLDTEDVVVDLDGDGNVVKTVGVCRDGVVDTTKREGKGEADADADADAKPKEEQAGEGEGEGEGEGKDDGTGKARETGGGHSVLVLSIEAPAEHDEEY
ncbi:uncharacterized protein UV8b_02333 [Ustilaginoidea virens]|uniref:Intramembrane protease n=1 Tax=Ustilaginoidea virens TaxID=1159556 RepID=A0A8E5MFR6_USTVR|nr:uncharacterized protein UV8b_02333 [Ustilaginoidea virens]QUC18092.1 hypothetical protein UV8b_02333 [Ustilaginoidea virens]